MTFTSLARTALLGLALLGLALAAGPAHAQTSDALFQDLGGQPGLVALMEDFMPRLLADARMNPFFRDVDQTKLKAQLVSQFCAVSGGSCQHKGPDMKKAHAGVDITRANFNALVEVLQDSMDARGVAFSVQNRLLARLAPMHREVVNTP